eukprot:14071950-Heterocapsa_arctica.AAC.1
MACQGPGRSLDSGDLRSVEQGGHRLRGSPQRGPSPSCRSMGPQARHPPPGPLGGDSEAGEDHRRLPIGSQ